ncbi:MAG: pyridoxal 5'-phosphate synthase glutaminase subunit PdxT [Thermoanaerobaculaceae bacterium]
MERSPVVGLLALQGDFDAHRKALAERGVESVEIRVPSDLDEVSGLVLPGGESTTMLKLLEGTGLDSRLVDLVRAGMPVLATCAGVILLAREVRHPVQRSLAILDILVERNGYGRQIDSAVVDLEVADPSGLGSTTLEGVFIRAPRVTEVGEGVRVLARRGGDPVLLRQGKVLAATFHPELTDGSPVVDLFVRILSAPG